MQGSRHTHTHINFSSGDSFPNSPKQEQETEFQSGFLPKVTGTQLPEPPLTAYQRHISRKLELETQPRLEFRAFTWVKFLFLNFITL